MLVAPQIRMARAAVGLSVRQLADLSGVADSTILRFETGRGSILASNLARIQKALEDAGVMFIEADGSVLAFGFVLKSGSNATSPGSGTAEASAQRL
jgi:transcriptional regulator with XRE-family HTH domain